MHAYRMTVYDYQDLIDQGWRRSGKYLYRVRCAESAGVQKAAFFFVFVVLCCCIRSSCCGLRVLQGTASAPPP
jgi:hypothetical protein